MSVEAFGTRRQVEFRTIREKCLGGDYRFSPYAEQLKSKGRAEPRVISVPTVRDRVVLQALKEFLHAAFPECVARQLPNAMIRDVMQTLETISRDEISLYRTDIKSCYGSISHDRLMATIDERIRVTSATRLVRRALRNPTVPLASRRTEHGRRSTEGVPQGLAVSNILANIALSDFDSRTSSIGIARFRYVDDLLFVVESSQASAVKAAVEGVLGAVGLGTNPYKTTLEPVSKPFGYLGYLFKWPMVTVEPAKVDRLLHAMAGRFTKWRHTIRYRRRSTWLTEEMITERALDEINERITGAVNEQHRYGWLFHYLEINDLRLLYQLDGAVRSMALRKPTFPGVDRLKTFVRGYYEALYHPHSGYIHDYTQFAADRATQEEFLASRGYANPYDLPGMTDGEVREAFDRVRLRRLSRLERDAGSFS